TQFAECHIAWWITAHEVDKPRSIGVVTLRLGLGDRQHDVAVRVVDREHAGRPDDTDFKRIDRGRPGYWQGPGHVEVIDGAVGEVDHASGAIDTLVRGPKNLVDRPRVTLDRGFALQTPHADIEGVCPRNHHRGNRRRIVGAFVIIDCDET